MAAIKAQFKELKAALKKLGAKDAGVTPVPPLPLKKMEALEKKHKFALPAPLRDYYLKTNGHFISWSLPGGEAGSSSVFDANTLFTNRTSAFYEGDYRQDVPYYSKRLGDDQKRLLEEDYLLFERAFIDTFVLVSKQESAEDAALYLLEYPFELTRLDLGFEQYLEELFKHQARVGWQQQFKQGGGPPDAKKSSAKKSSVKKSAAKKSSAKKSSAKKAAPGAAGAGSYRRRLDDLVKRLKASDKIVEVQLQTYPAPQAAVFRKIEATFDSEFPEDMAKFYGELNGLKLVWRSRPEVAPSAHGVIDIPPLEKAFGGHYYALAADWDDYVTHGALWDEELKEAFPDEFRAVNNKRVFDRHLVRNQVLLELSGGSVKFFYYVDRGVIELKADFEKLVGTLFETGGVEYYPELLRGRADKQFAAELAEKVRLFNPDFSPEVG